MVLGLNGSGLEPEHLKKSKEEICKCYIPEILPPFRFVYNNKEIFLLKKRIKVIKKSLKSSFNGEIRRKKSIKKRCKKRDLKFMFLGFSLSVSEGPERSKEERDKKIRKQMKKLILFLKMSLFQNLHHLRGKNKRLEKLEDIIKKNKKIKYIFKNLIFKV